MAAMRARRCPLTSMRALIALSGTLGSSSGTGRRNGSPVAVASAASPASSVERAITLKYSLAGTRATAATVISWARTWSGWP